jgi:hypothetical protein
LTHDQRLLVRIQNAISIFDLAGGQLPRQVRLTGKPTDHGNVYSTEALVSGRWFVARADAGWDLVDLAGTRTLFFPQEAPQAAKLAGSGTRALLIGDTDIVLVDLESGAILTRVEQRVETEKTAISDSGDLIAFGVSGGAILSRLDPLQLKTNLCSRPGHNLTPSEWTRYVGDTSPTATCPLWK